MIDIFFPKQKVKLWLYSSKAITANQNWIGTLKGVFLLYLLGWKAAKLYVVREERNDFLSKNSPHYWDLTKKWPQRTDTRPIL